MVSLKPAAFQTPMPGLHPSPAQACPLRTPTGSQSRRGSLSGVPGVEGRRSTQHGAARAQGLGAKATAGPEEAHPPHPPSQTVTRQQADSRLPEPSDDPHVLPGQLSHQFPECHQGQLVLERGRQTLPPTC